MVDDMLRVEEGCRRGQERREEKGNYGRTQRRKRESHKGEEEREGVIGDVSGRKSKFVDVKEKRVKKGQEKQYMKKDNVREVLFRNKEHKVRNERTQ